jgi:uncharacterized protein YecE (DUF72 family)
MLTWYTSVVTVHIGPAGWSYEDWAGIVYPKPRPRGFSELSFLSHYFDVIEINTTFYHPIAPDLSKGWIRKVAAGDFRFTAKLWQRLTHDAAPFAQDDVRVYREGIEPLIHHGILSAVLVQFAWSFSESKENRDRIERIRDAFKDLPLVVELRHVSWNTPDVLKFLKDRELGFCNTDQPASKGAISNTSYVTSRLGYVRFHGRNRSAWFNSKSSVAEKYNYLYSVEELKPWVESIKSMSEEGAEVFVIGNNHFQGKGVVNALQLKSLLTGKPVGAPGTVVEHYSKELSGFVSNPTRQPELFKNL